MIPNPYPGIFFAFEGPDGCGKTKQLEKAASWIKSLWTIRDLKIKKMPCRFNVVETKEPGKDRLYGKKIYADLNTPGGLHETQPLGFQEWYACDSKEHMKTIVVPALEAGSVVLTDRFRLSLVYGARNATEIESLLQMNRMILAEHFIWPDATFIFDVSVENAIERLMKKGRKLDGHETEKKLEQVRQNYVFFALTRNCHLIDANRPPEAIFDVVKKIILLTIESRLKNMQ